MLKTCSNRSTRKSCPNADYVAVFGSVRKCAEVCGSARKCAGGMVSVCGSVRKCVRGMVSVRGSVRKCAEVCASVRPAFVRPSCKMSDPDIFDFDARGCALLVEFLAYALLLLETC